MERAKELHGLHRRHTSSSNWLLFIVKDTWRVYLRNACMDCSEFPLDKNNRFPGKYKTDTQDGHRRAASLTLTINDQVSKRKATHQRLKPSEKNESTHSNLCPGPCGHGHGQFTNNQEMPSNCLSWAHVAKFTRKLLHPPESPGRFLGRVADLPKGTKWSQLLHPSQVSHEKPRRLSKVCQLLDRKFLERMWQCHSRHDVQQRMYDQVGPGQLRKLQTVFLN